MVSQFLSAYDRAWEETTVGRAQCGETCQGVRNLSTSSPYGLLIRLYSFWARCIPGAGAGTQARFKETLGMFFEAVNIQAEMRHKKCIPDLESYIAIRRDTSGNFYSNISKSRQLIDLQAASRAGR